MVAASLFDVEMTSDCKLLVVLCLILSVDGRDRPPGSFLAV